MTSKPPMFYCSSLPQVGEVAVLDPKEARHATAARRLAAGDEIVLFDGLGVLAQGIIGVIPAKKRGLEVLIQERRTQPPPRNQLHLASALPKGDRQGVLLDMVTQLGVLSFIPLNCARSVVRAGAGAAGRWSRICVEACKQSRRAYLPTLRPEVTPARAAEQAAAMGHGVWIAHPSGSPLPVPPASAAFPGPLLIMIGPEGGFTDAEIEGMVACGGVPVALGHRVLRTETAAVALSAYVMLQPGKV